MYEIGHRWAVDGLNVAEEHYATAVTQQLLDELSARMRMPPRDGRLAVVSGTPGERHALGARMVADFLEADGWEVLQLGADTPAADLAALVDSERPDVVALSTSTAGSLPGIVDVLDAARAPAAAAVPRGRRAVLDGGDEPGGAGARRGRRRARPARAHRRAAGADPAAEPSGERRLVPQAPCRVGYVSGP